MIAANLMPTNPHSDIFSLGTTQNAPTQALSSQGHSLFAQLRSRFPQGALISELVQVHDGQFVVRAIVQVGTTTMATGMSAAPQIEVAEDRARVRAMEVLGISPMLAFDAAPRFVSEPIQEPEPARIEPAITPSKPDTIEAVLPEIASPASTEIESPISVERNAAEIAPPAMIPEAIASQASPGIETSIEPIKKFTRKKKEEPISAERNREAIAPPSDLLDFPGLDVPQRKPAPPKFEMDYSYDETPAFEDPTPPRSEPIDLSDAIAQIGTEIERIGWTKKQGSTYLQDTYGKKTRAELTEDELLEFLHYLKALPSKGHPSLSQIPF